MQRYYVSEGFIEALVEPPTYRYLQPDLVHATIVIHEGKKYSFGNINFVGPTLYGGEALRGQILDLIRQPYTDGAARRYPAADPVLLQNARLLCGPNRGDGCARSRAQRPGAGAGDG